MPAASLGSRVPVARIPGEDQMAQWEFAIDERTLNPSDFSGSIAFEFTIYSVRPKWWHFRMLHHSETHTDGNLN
jgi:hypothetical protein